MCTPYVENLYFHNPVFGGWGRSNGHHHHMQWMSGLETVRAWSICSELRQIIFYDHRHFSKMTPTRVKKPQTKMLCRHLGFRRTSQSCFGKRDEWMHWYSLTFLLSFLSCLCGLCLTTTLMTTPPFHARMQRWPSKEGTSFASSAWRTTPGGRRVASGTAAPGPGSSPRSSSMRGRRPATCSLAWKHPFWRMPGFIYSYVFHLSFFRRVALQRPKALFTPQRVRQPPGDEPQCVRKNHHTWLE